MFSSKVGELDAWPCGFTGYAYVRILHKASPPSMMPMEFPEPELFHLVQNNSPIHKSSVVKAWFRQHPEITLCHIHPHRQI